MPDLRANVGRGTNVMRILQLDAHSLDMELVGMLQQKLLDAFALFDHAKTEAVRPEMEGLLQLGVAYLSLYPDGITPGMRLMNLRFRDERSVPAAFPNAGAAFPLKRAQKVLLILATVVLPYMWRRLNRLMVTRLWADDDDASWRSKAYRLYNAVDTVTTVLRCANFVAFLVNGRYRTLAHRAAGARAVYAAPQHSRLVSYDLLNQQLAWFAVTDFLQAVLPLVNFGALQRTVNRMWQGAGGGATAGLQREGPLSLQCVACGAASATMPHVGGPCGCVHCYACVRAAVAEGPGTCAGCGKQLLDEHVAWLKPPAANLDKQPPLDPG